MMKKKRPLLTIAIPTWNRASYLRLNLEQLARECAGEVAEQVEILVSDNCSGDDTGAVVSSCMDAGLAVRYIRNQENIGSDCNIAQCFNKAAGRYVLVLGDDDILVDGAVAFLLELLRNKAYGVVTIRAYGYEDDFRREYPGGSGRVREFGDSGEFAVAVGIFSTLISANLICKDLLAGVDARDFCGSNLVQTHMFYRAMLAAEENCLVDRYLVACKRNNSGGYVFSRVFVDRFGEILDECQVRGLSRAAVARLERRLVVGFFPFYVFGNWWRVAVRSIWKKAGNDIKDDSGGMPPITFFLRRSSLFPVPWPLPGAVLRCWLAVF